MKLIVFILSIVASEALGLAVAEVYFRLFLRAVPPAAMSGFNVGATHAMFLLYGLAVGVAFFGWAMVAAGMGRLMGRKRSPTPQGSRAPAAERPGA